MLKKVLAVALGILCLTGLLCVGAARADTQPSNNVIYQYALLGDTYTPEAGLISATSPNGETIAADTKQVVLDWSTGSYIFVYKNKTVNLKVYESAPQDSLTVNGKVPAATSQGLKTRFPGFSAISTIRRTDGTPAIAPYQVSAAFWFNGKQVQLIQNVARDFDFTPTESGMWMVSYQYTDIFGRVRSQDYPFTVTSDRIIVSQIKEAYYIGNVLSNSNAYGYYNGRQYPVRMELQCPDGSMTQVDDKLVLSQDGEHTVTVTAEMEGQTVTNSYAFLVNAGLQSFVTNVEGFSEGIICDKYEYQETLSESNQGLLLDMTTATASLTYNGVVDLRELGKDVPVISFTTNQTYGGSISKVVVTLTDVYDANNSVAVTFTRNSDMTETTLGGDNTFVQPSFGNNAVAVGNYFPLKNTSVGWGTTFHGFWYSPANDNPDKTYAASSGSQAMNLAFDTATNTVYSYGYFYLVEWEDKMPPAGYPTDWNCQWFPIADLDSEDLTAKFSGFTTGEVYVKLSVEAGRGDLMLHSIGGVSMANLQQGYETNAGILLKDFDGSLPAAVGVEYTLPQGTSRYIENITRTVTLNGTKTEGSGFTPDQTGACTVTYEGINQFGIPVSKTVSMMSMEKPKLTVSYATQTVKIGELYTIAEPEISGYGKLSYSMTLNGEAVKPGQRVIVREEMNLTVTAQDALASIEKIFSLNVDKNAVDFRIDFPRAAVCGSSFTFPQAEVYDYLSGNVLDYDIYADGIKQDESMLLPEEPDTVQVEYRTARGSRTYTLYVKTAEVTTGAEALLLPLDAIAVTGDAGTMVTVNAVDPVVRLPYHLSATSLQFQFIVLKDELNFNTMTIRMTGDNAVAVTASVVGLMEEQPHLYVNGHDTLVKLNKQAQTFASGTYEGKEYYTYTLEYHDMHKAMMNASKIEAVVETDASGVLFRGFGGGVYLDIYPENIQGSAACFGITQIGNQYFYTSAFEYGDIVPPSLYATDFFIGNNNVESGYVLRLSGLKAYDVLQAESTLEVSLTLSDGTVHCQNAAPATVEDAVFKNVGTYILKIKSQDSAGAQINVSYRFTVEDETAPELSVSGNMAQTAKPGGKLVLPGATATDDSTVTLSVAVFNPKGQLTIFDGTGSKLDSITLENLLMGTYRIRYIASDEMGNITTQIYTVKVEG